MIQLAQFSLVVLLSVAMGACSFSYSSEKVSDSSGSSSDSSASSSGSSQRAYQTDVSDYTTAYVKSSQDYSAFRSGVADLARKRGINDWESNTGTWQGIGAGLRRAGVSKLELDVYKQNLTGGDSAHQSLIQKGYDAASK